MTELGAAMLSGVCGIGARVRHAGYLDHWLKVLKADKRAIFTAASAAQAAADELLNRAWHQADHDSQAAE